VPGYAIVVSVDDAPIAVAMFCTDARAGTGIIASFDFAFAKWSPGALAVETFAKWAFDRPPALAEGFTAEPGAIDILFVHTPDIIQVFAAFAVKANVIAGAIPRYRS
jgi:hypothetical protein